MKRCASAENISDSPGTAEATTCISRAAVSRVLAGAVPARRRGQARRAGVQPAQGLTGIPQRRLRCLQTASNPPRRR